MTNDQIHAFREGFCEKAAELGLCPSELLSYRSMEKKALGLKEIADLIKDNTIAATSFGLLGGAGIGALGSYIYNKAKFDLDPEGSMLDGMDASTEAKKLHLMAKYRDAVRQLKAGVK
ncbi:MAG: hypothetical protein FJ336_06965 [Sphingomonadales bacterium]|nr:hypothetical protein [Sphingomonadales bacterium]